MLQNRLKPVVQKRMGLAIAVWGDAGVGKTHQVSALLQHLSCRHKSLHATSSVASLVQNLERPIKLALWAERKLQRLMQGEDLAKDALDTLMAVFAALAPFVLHLEDIHEVDDEQLAFIQALASGLQKVKGAALIVTSRKEPPEPFLAIRLEPLTQAETKILLETELKNSLPKEALQWLYDKAAGNPLYSLEYLRVLTRQGVLWNDGKTWHWRKPENNLMPVTVEALIEQLLDQARIDPLQRYVLESKAFLPLDSTDEVWQKVARVSESELQTAITKLTQQRIFKDNGFAHPLYREVTLRTLSAERKRNLARRAINVLLDRPDQAAHFVKEAQLEASQSLALLKQAAEYSRKDKEIEAAKFLARAVEYASGEVKIELALEAADRLRNHDMNIATALTESVLEAKPYNLKAKILLTKLYALQFRKDEALQMLSSLPAEYKETKEGVETSIEVYNRLEELETVVSIFKAHAHFSPFPALTVGLVMGSLSGLSRYDEVEHLAAETLSGLTPDSWDYVAILHALAFMHNASKQYAKGEAEFRRVIELIEKYHEGKRLYIPLDNHANGLIWLTRFQEAKPEAERSRQLALEAGDIVMYATVQLSLGEIEHEFSNYERAEDLLLEAADILVRRAPSEKTVDVYTNLSTLYSEWFGPPTNAILALNYSRTSLQLARDFVNHYLLYALHYAALAESRYGNPHRALELAEETRRVAATQTQFLPASYYASAAMGMALKALLRFDEARLELANAEGVAWQLELTMFAQKIGLELDHLNNDIESARQRMQWFQEHGLKNGLNIAKRYFPDLAEPQKAVETVEVSLRLEVLGPLQFLDKTVKPIRGRKRQELLAQLLAARLSGRIEVSRLALIDALYRDEDELKAGSSLKTVIYSLRETLGNAAISTSATGYALGITTSDAEQFLQTGDTSLWRGVYCGGLMFDDLTVPDLLYTALFDKAKALLEADPKEVARLGSILIEAEPYNSGYLKLYLAALRLTRNHGKLTRHYQEAKKRFLEVGETLPERWQDFLSKSQQSP